MADLIESSDKPVPVFMPVTAKVGDLVGTMVPFDVMKDDWLIGHHIECRTIIPAQNVQGYIVNGDVFLPAQIATTLLSLMAQERNKLAAQGRPATTAWEPTERPPERRWCLSDIVITACLVLLMLSVLASTYFVLK